MHMFGRTLAVTLMLDIMLIPTGDLVHAGDGVGAAGEIKCQNTSAIPATFSLKGVAIQVLAKRYDYLVQR